MTDDVLAQVLAQLLALVTFFAFPAFQYVWLRQYSRKEGVPELWYLPAYGFRLVMRNNPGTKTLSEIRYRALIRNLVPKGTGASVETWDDKILHEREDYFLFPHADQMLVCFRLDVVETGLILLHTDKLGRELARVPMPDKSILIADYVANVENLFNFDVKVAKRVEISAAHLAEAAAIVAKNNVEQECRVTRVRDVG